MGLNKEYLISKNVLVFICAILMIWITIMIAAPILILTQKQFLIKTGEWIYFFCEPTCHQIPERSFFINGVPLAVCIRCLSFYIGGLIVIALQFFKKTINEKYIKWLVLLCVPLLIDFILEKMGVYNNIIELRIITGVLFGGSFFYLILLSISQIQYKNVG